MRNTFFALLLTCLVLCGCSAVSQTEDAAASPTASAGVQATEPHGYYDPDSALEAETGGALRCYPLGSINGTSIMALTNDLLVFSCTETTTTLTVLSGETLYPSAAMELDIALDSGSISLRPSDGSFSFFDMNTRETIVLDHSLREIRRIAAPDDISGFPLLSPDRSILYYCTSDAIRALDLETGISRVLKEVSASYQAVTGLWLNDTVLECTFFDENSWETLFLSTQTGQILGSAADEVTFTAFRDRYYAIYPEGAIRTCLFGSLEGEIQTLTPRGDSTNCSFLPKDNAAVVIRHQLGDSQITLDYYDLDSGLCTSSLNLETGFYPWNFQTTADGQVWFLNYDEAYGCNTLYCWDTAATPTGDNTVHIGPYYTRAEPDYDGLAACTLYAKEIGSKYGIEVLIYKDAAEIHPWDYDLEYEYLVPVIRKELELLDQRLANYPEGFLQTLAGRFDSLKICIVRSLTGTAESGSLDTASGIQFWDGYNACIALAAGRDTEHALYHELCHLIDTVVITESSAYDRWEELNPKGFKYDYDYIANQTRNSGEYLRESGRSFIDTYSMSFPKEDRARIMEYAMTEGNEAYFQSSTMQAKLKLLCEGIREAFGLKKSADTFLWEQYLNTSLAHTG